MTSVLFGSVPHSIGLPARSSIGCVDWIATIRHDPSASWMNG